VDLSFVRALVYSWNLVIEIFRQLRNAAQFPSGNPDYLRLFGLNCPPIASVVMPTRKITAFVIDSNVVLLCAGVSSPDHFHYRDAQQVVRSRETVASRLLG